MKRRNPKHDISIILIISFLTILATGWYLFYVRNFTPVLRDPIIVEYGQEEITKDDILETVPENKRIEIVDLPEIKTDKVLEQEITITLQKGIHKQEQTIPIQVKDTKPPIVTIVEPEIDITKGEDTKDIEDNIVEIKDPVDGPIDDIQRGSLLECSMFLRNRMFKSNCVFIGTDFNVQECGDYEVKIVSYDRSGNLTVRSFIVHVKDTLQKGVTRSTKTTEDTALVLEDNESLYHSTLDESYIPVSLLFGQETLYPTIEEAQNHATSLQTQGVLAVVETISGILDNKGISHDYFIVRSQIETPNEKGIPALT